MWNQPEHLEAYFAVPAMGAVIHTLNPRLHPDELSFIVDNAEDSGDHRRRVAARGVRGLPPRAGLQARDRRLASGRLPDGTIDYESLIRPPSRWSGRTGRAARGGHVLHVGHDRTAQGRGLLAPGAGAAFADGGAADSNGASAQGHGPASGADVPRQRLGAALCRRRSSARGWCCPARSWIRSSVLDLIADEQVTLTAGVPTVWMAVLQALDAEPDRWDLGALQRLLVGGAAIPRSLLEGFDRTA